MAEKRKDEAEKKRPGRPRSRRTKQEKGPQQSAGSESARFPIVGIGASAGGLEAITAFFKAMPEVIADIAFVVVSHLDPSHSSSLPELIQHHTRIQVNQISTGTEVEPGRIYVIPPDNNLTLEDGKFILSQFEKVSVPRAPINHFFRSLAEHHGEKAVGIILSGMGSDGTIGVQAIKGELGMVMVQDPETAKYDGMPQSALNTGLADFVLGPGSMPLHLLEYFERMEKMSPVSVERMPSDALKKIHARLRATTGHDFSHYKESTIRRRIGRRMNVHGMTHISEYVRYLMKEPEETSSLIKELLIGVTSFFRDKGAFDALQKKALPKLLNDKPAGYTVRVWVVGCATGQEAYSIAMVLTEYIEEHHLDMGMQVFATDLDAEAISRARAGVYSGDISEDVSAERLRRFFTKENNNYRVSPNLRERIVFAQQSVIKDPPFTKIDLLSCRNLLIYLDIPIQKKMVPLFHYSLKAGGALFLGTSETIGQHTDLFSTLDSQWKIFERIPGAAARIQAGDFPMQPPGPLREKGMPGRKPEDMSKMVERALLDYHTPPAIIIDFAGNIRYIHGRVTKYLEHPQGPFRTYNAFEIAREGLKLQLMTAMRKIRPDSAEMKRKIQIGQDGGKIDALLTVKPLSRDENSGLYMILIEELPEMERKEDEQGSARESGAAAPPSQELEQELQDTRERLRTVVEELESSNEELRSANEEYQSTNEELQSANEELNSSKEELQSLNEELETVNSELQEKVRQVETAYKDMNKMLNSLGIPCIFLDHNLCIRRFSTDATHIMDPIEGDVGRPIKQLSSKVLDVNLDQEAREVLATMHYREQEVRTDDGQWYLMRILPYQAEEGRGPGVVFTFVDIKDLKETSRQLAAVDQARRYAEGIVETVREPLIVLDKDLKVISANESFYRTFRISREEVEQISLFELGGGEWENPDLRRLLEEVLPRRQSFQDFVVTHQFKEIGKRRMRLNARRIHEEGIAKERILLAFEDVTQMESEC